MSIRRPGKKPGSSVQDYIRAELIDVAKEKIFDTNKIASQIAYELGFKYPKLFARAFKQRAAVSLWNTVLLSKSHCFL